MGYYKFLLIGLLVLTSCSNWNYTTVSYDKCVHLDKIHVHFYHHETCEWSCLDMSEGNYTFTEEFKIKYKLNKKSNVTKVKLVK